MAAGVPYSELLTPNSFLHCRDWSKPRMSVGQAKRMTKLFRLLADYYGPGSNNHYLMLDPGQCVILKNPSLSCNYLKDPAVHRQLYHQIMLMRPHWWLATCDTTTTLTQGIAPR